MAYDPGFADYPQPSATPFASRVCANAFDKAAAPGTGDDIADGWSAGSIWYDSTNTKLYICVSAAVGAAVWKEITIT